MSSTLSVVIAVQERRFASLGIMKFTDCCTASSGNKLNCHHIFECRLSLTKRGAEEINQSHLAAGQVVVQCQSRSLYPKIDLCFRPFKKMKTERLREGGASVMHGLHIYAKSPVNCISMSKLW